jgi:hypothetical protein
MHPGPKRLDCPMIDEVIALHANNYEFMESLEKASDKFENGTITSERKYKRECRRTIKRFKIEHKKLMKIFIDNCLELEQKRLDQIAAEEEEVDEDDDNEVP